MVRSRINTLLTTKIDFERFYWCASLRKRMKALVADLEVDEGAYDDDLEPIESGAGACTVAVESTHEASNIPRTLAG